MRQLISITIIIVLLVLSQAYLAPMLVEAHSTDCGSECVPWFVAFLYYLGSAGLAAVVGYMLKIASDAFDD